MMGQENGTGKLFTGIVKVNLYSSILAAITSLGTGLMIGMISFVIYLHFIAALPVIMNLESFSERKIAEKLWKILR
jgi:hypothetical protein